MAPGGNRTALIIKRYLYREVLQTFAAVLAVLGLVYGAVRFTRFLDDAAAGLVSADLILQMLAFKLLEKLPVLLPIAIYLAVLIGMGRLYRDNEITALGAGGVGIWQISKGVAQVVAGISIAGAALSLFVSPDMASMQKSVIEKARQKAESRVFVPGRFKEFGGGDQIVFVEAVDSDTGRMSGVFVRIRKPGRQYLLVSDTARQTRRPGGGGRFMILENGHRYAGLPGDAAFSVTEFERYVVRIGAEPKPKEGVVRRGKMLATMDLIGSGDPRHVAELQRRISTAVSILLLGLLAVPLARTSPREGRRAKLFTAVFVYFIYSNTASIFERLLERGMLPGFVGVWPVHVALALVVLVLLLDHQTVAGWRFGAMRRSAERKPGRSSER